jgi:hypothetical protein
MMELKATGMSDFDVKNNIQTFLARTLSLLYAEVNKIMFLYIHNILVEKIHYSTLYFKQFVSNSSVNFKF